VNYIEGISIVPSAEEHLESLNRCIDTVARQRLYIGLVEGPTLAQTREFIRTLISAGGVQFVALDGTGCVVGWCDIMRLRLEGFRHSGRLGMGLLPSLRGRGIGRRLAEATIQAAIAQGMERIELAVFASNVSAIALYERLGFIREGVKRNARKIDSRYDDDVMMALMAPSPAPTDATR
jgi:RimJ/RimL family protein N-acetyltransferase